MCQEWLSTYVGKKQATGIVVRAGYTIAIALLIWGIFQSTLLMAIGVLLFFSTNTEKELSQRREWLNGYQVRDAMDTNWLCLPITATVDEAMNQFASQRRGEYVVVTDKQEITGLISFDLLQNLSKVSQQSIPLRSMMDTQVEILSAEESLPDVYGNWHQESEVVYPVQEKGVLVGLLHTDKVESLLLAVSKMNAVKK